MPPQVSAGSITDAHLLDQGGIVQTALLQIADRFRMAVELELIEGGRLLQQPGKGSGCKFLLEKRYRLVERQIEEELDKADQVATPAAAVTVEQILSGVDVEGRTSILVQRAQTDELLASAGTTRLPVVALQVLHQRNALFEPLQILDHGAAFASESRVDGSQPYSQARMVGGAGFL